MIRIFYLFGCIDIRCYLKEEYSLKKKIVKKAVAFSVAVVSGFSILSAYHDSSFINQTSLTAYAEENEESFGINKTFLKAGNTLEVSNPAGYTLRYYVDGSEIETDALVLTEDYFEKWITVKAFSGSKEVAEDKAYFSNLPVLYINTDDGSSINSRDVYKSGAMSVQSSDEAAAPVYDDKISIKGRGNASWTWPKKSFRLKLDKKADLLGLGANKNWVLIANYLDECLLRNKTAYDLSKEMGLESMDCTWTDVVLNGKYAGNYLLCEQIRIDETRVDIFDWEEEAKDVAKAIVKAEKKNGNTLDQDALEEQMKSDLSWVTSGQVKFNGVTYKTDKEYSDISGGYLFELSDEYDEVSKFKTDTGLKVMLNSPEYLNTNQTMMNYVTNYWKNFEKAYRSEDGYVNTSEGRKHYTEFADIDSMVSFWLTLEIMGNDDSIYKSRYAYKDMGSLIKFGPVWDFDYGCGSIEVDYGSTWWKISQNPNAQAFFKDFIDDPLFIAKATEKYWQIRPYLEELIRDGGILDSNTAYLLKSGQADGTRWDRHATWPSKARGFEGDAKVFKQFLTERITWMDTKFISDATLVKSLYSSKSNFPYTKSDDKLPFTLSSNAAKDTNTKAPANGVIEAGSDVTVNFTVNDSNTVSLETYVNGIYYGSFAVSNKKASIKITNDRLTALPETKNVISVIGKNSSKGTTYKNFCTVIQKEEKITVPQFKTNNLVLSGQMGVNFYLDLSPLTDAEKAASYMEFTVNGKTTSDSFDADFKNTTDKYYGFTCYVTSVEMADTIKAVFHYGNGRTVEETYSVLDYINKIEENESSYDKTTLSLIHSIADYGHYVQPFLAANNNWEIGREHAEMNRYYAESYNFDSVKNKTEQYKRILELGKSDIDKITYALSLNAETTLNVFIKPKSGYSGNVSVTTKKGSTVTSYTAVKQSDGRYKVTIPNISSHQLGDTYVITAATENGTATCSLSALSYVYAVLDDSNSDNTAKNAVSSFYKYFNSTIKYREKA